MFEKLVKFVRELYGTYEFIPLHEPHFVGNEKRYVNKCIDSTFVSSVGEYVDRFECKISEYTGIKYAIATVNGTAALHVALMLSGVKQNTEVLTQSLTFIATSNAIRYCGAFPIFIDVEKTTLGLCPQKLESFLEEYGELRDDGYCWNKSTNRRIIACLPMHTFGFPVRLDEIKKICTKYNIALIEDAAESLGSFYKGGHTGTIGKLSAVSFNGNKIITTGGGGMILTNDANLANRAKHITTTAKLKNSSDFSHDEIGFNYRLPNINAALGVAQLEDIRAIIRNKRWVAQQYHDWGGENGVAFAKEPINTHSNYWLNTIVAENQQCRDAMLEATNKCNVMTRPVWKPLHTLEMYKSCPKGELINTDWLSERLINVPSSPVMYEK